MEGTRHLYDVSLMKLISDYEYFTALSWTIQITQTQSQRNCNKKHGIELPLGILHFCLILPGYNLFLSSFRFIICLFVIIIILSTSYEYYLEVIKQKEEILDSSKTQNKDKEISIEICSLYKCLFNLGKCNSSTGSTKQKGCYERPTKIRCSAKWTKSEITESATLRSGKLWNQCEIFNSVEILNFSAYILYLIIDHLYNFYMQNLRWRQWRLFHWFPIYELFWKRTVRLKGWRVWMESECLPQPGWYLDMSTSWENQ